MSENGLKACPFCGSEKLTVWSKEVECDDCGATGPKSRQYASAEWNRRHQEQETSSTFERWVNK